MPSIYVTDPIHFYTFGLPTAPGAEVYIGTASSCQLCLPGAPGLAEVHACITCQGSEYMITDLGSPGGTFANGSQVRSVFLMPGVEYRMGSVVISLVVENAPPPQQRPMPWGAQPMAPQQPVMMQPVAPQMWAQPQGVAPQVVYTAAPQQVAGSEPAKKAPRAKMRHLSAAELDDLKSRFYSPSSHSFPFGKIILFLLVLLAIAFFANMLPFHREDALRFFRDLSRDMETPAQ